MGKTWGKRGKNVGKMGSDWKKHDFSAKLGVEQQSLKGFLRMLSPQPIGFDPVRSKFLITCAKD